MKKIALIGANGMLSTAIQRLVPVDYSIMPYDLPDFDLTNREQVSSLRENDPDIIINCAAFTNVDGCEEQQEFAMRVNGDGPGLLADLAKKNDAVLIHISTDFIFDGRKNTPYREDDQPNPLSIYGKSKLLGEQKIVQSGLTRYFIVRTSWLYGPKGPNFVETIIRLAKEREELGIVADQIGTPTYAEDLAETIWKLVSPVTHHPSQITAPYGIYHYSNNGFCSWYEFACAIVEQLRIDNVLLKLKVLKPITTAEYPVLAQRPAYSVLSKEKYMQVTGDEVPDWRQGLKKYYKERCSDMDDV